MSLAWYDGKFVDKSSITISPADFGFSRGIAIFELTRVYGGKPFHLADHLARLMDGAKTLGIACPASIDELTSIVQKLCAENRYAHSAVKFYLTAGECAKPSGTSFAACDGFTPHLMIMEDEVRPAHPEAPYGLETYQRGQKLKTVAHERELATVKSTNYALGYHAARMQAGKEWDDILFTQADGAITESTRSNFFAVIDGVLCTAKDGILLGVTRKVMLELAAKLGIRAEVCGFTASDLARASEAFVTGSIAEMLPVKQVDSHVMPTTMEGPVFSKLRKAFTEYIRASA